MTTEEILQAVRELAWCGVADEEHGCCSACDGTGRTCDPSANGGCWDCRGTGHAHAPSDDEAFASAVVRVAHGLSASDEMPSGVNPE